MDLNRSIAPKELILATFSAASSIAVFWLWHKVTPKIIAGEFQNYTDFLWPVLGLVLAAALFSLSSLFIRNGRVIYLAAALSVGVPYFFLTATTTVVAVLVVSLLLIIYAVMRVRIETKHSVGFSASKFLKGGLPLYFTAVSVLVSVFLFSEIGKDENRALAALLPRSALEQVWGPLQSLIGLQGVKPDATVDAALTELIVNQLKSQGIESVPKTELTKLIVNQRAELSRNFGLKLSGQEGLGDILYEFISFRFRELLGPYKIYLPYASALAFFFAFKAFTFPIYYLTLLITFLLIKLMFLAKILRSEKQQIEVERLIL